MQKDEAPGDVPGAAENREGSSTHCADCGIPCPHRICADCYCTRILTGQREAQERFKRPRRGWR